MMKNTSWAGSYAKSSFPSLPCPNCGDGRVGLVETTVVVREPKYSKDQKGHQDSEPEWTVERFCAFLICNNNMCGEEISVSGDIEWVDELDEEHGWYVVGNLRPKNMTPSPPIISLPPDLDAEIQEDIIKSFSLYWIDLDSCANKLRISVEKILDHFKIPRQQTNRNGKVIFLRLVDRIDAFKEISEEHASTMDALRLVGNLGSHDGGLERGMLLDTYRIFEAALKQMFADDAHEIKAIRQKIIDKLAPK
jgi:hypothetical protein